MPESDIAKKIVEILSSRPNYTISGAALGILVKDLCGYSSAAHGKLRDFIAANVPSVVEVGQSGLDCIYGLKSPPQNSIPVNSDEAASAKPPVTLTQRPLGSVQSSAFWKVDPKVWKTFVSPSGAFALYGNRDTGELTALGKDESPPDRPWLQISTCTIEDHTNTALEWFGTITDAAARSALEASIKDGTGPNSPFYDTVKKTGLVFEWNRFRSKRLLGILESRLAELGIPKKDAPRHPPQFSVLPRASMAAPHSVHDIARAALSRMTATELRNLPIPLGHILDVLNIR